MTAYERIKNVEWYDEAFEVYSTHKTIRPNLVAKGIIKRIIDNSENKYSFNGFPKIEVFFVYCSKYNSEIVIVDFEWSDQATHCYFTKYETRQLEGNSLLMHHLDHTIDRKIQTAMSDLEKDFK